MSHPNGDRTEPGSAWPPAAPAEQATQPVYSTPPSFVPSDSGPAAAASAPATQPLYPTPPSPANTGSVAAPAAPATQPGFASGAPGAPVSGAPIPGQAPAHVPGQVPGQAPGAAQAVYTPGAAVVPTGYADGTTSFPASGVPVSGYPVSGYPMPGYPAAKPKRTGMIVLTIATVLLGLTTIAFGALWIVESGKRSQADAKVAEQTTALAAADTKIKEVESKLSTKTSEAAQLNQDLAGAKNKTDEVTKARDALAACMQASDAYAANRNTNTAKELIAKCTEAEKYY